MDVHNHHIDLPHEFIKKKIASKCFVWSAIKTSRPFVVVFNDNNKISARLLAVYFVSI